MATKKISLGRVFVRDNERGLKECVSTKVQRIKQQNAQLKPGSRDGRDGGSDGRGGDENKENVGSSARLHMPDGLGHPLPSALSGGLRQHKHTTPSFQPHNYASCPPHDVAGGCAPIYELLEADKNHCVTGRCVCFVAGLVVVVLRGVFIRADKWHSSLRHLES